MRQKSAWNGWPLSFWGGAGGVRKRRYIDSGERNIQEKEGRKANKKEGRRKAVRRRVHVPKKYKERPFFRQKALLLRGHVLLHPPSSSSLCLFAVELEPVAAARGKRR